MSYVVRVSFKRLIVLPTAAIRPSTRLWCKCTCLSFVVLARRGGISSVTEYHLSSSREYHLANRRVPRIRSLLLLLMYIIFPTTWTTLMLQATDALRKYNFYIALIRRRKTAKGSDQQNYATVHRFLRFTGLKRPAYTSGSLRYPIRTSWTGPSLSLVQATSRYRLHENFFCLFSMLVGGTKK